MSDQQSLKLQLDTARQILNVLKQQKAGYTSLTIPAPLKLQLDDKEKEVASLEIRLGHMSGSSNRLANNLLRRPDIFVGRESEVLKCLQALDPNDRGWGVIIDGIGGIGKTDLALEVAHRSLEQSWFDAYLFATAKTTWLTPDGVRQQTLALSSLDAFIREFAIVLSYDFIHQITDATQRRRQFLDALSGRRTLLIFDNLETLTAQERDLIAEFLRKLPAPNKAIITSRHRTGESAITVRLDRLTEDEAFKLMDEKGHKEPRVANELNRDGKNAKQALYEAVGGSPLALHWILGLVAQKGYTFKDALELLEDANSAEDLYTFLFKDAIEGLTDDERTLISALSTFQTPANVRTLADASGLNGKQIDTALRKLIILSLVSDLKDETYGLHPLTRNYVHAALGVGSKVLRDALDNVTLDIVARRKAISYWVDYAKNYGGDNESAYQKFPYLESEWFNLEANAIALRELSGIPGKLKDTEAARMLIDLNDALRSFLWYKGYWDERLRLSEWAYQAAEALGFWKNAGWAAYSIAWIFLNRAETDRASVWADRTLEAMVRGGDNFDQAVANHLCGLVAKDSRNFTEAERLCTDALAAYRNWGDEIDQAKILNDLGIIAFERQNYKCAENYYHQAVEINEKYGEKTSLSSNWGNLGYIALQRNRLHEACNCYNQQLVLAREVGRQDLIANALTGLAEVMEKENRYTEALSLAEEAQKISIRLRHRNLKRINQVLVRLGKKLG